MEKTYLIIIHFDEERESVSGREKEERNYCSKGGHTTQGENRTTFTVNYNHTCGSK
jgi:hypothetical protein